MPFHPEVNQELVIDGVAYRIAEHPAAPGVPYGQEGRAAVVYQLLAPPASGESRGEDARALKVFKPRYRSPILVTLAGRLVPFASLPGLQVCRRSVLAPQHHAVLLRQHPDLTYAVLMPWVEGPTWTEVMLERRVLTPAESLTLSQSLVKVLVGTEQRGLAHCDLSASNVMLPLLVGGTSVALVDVEGIYGPGLERPREILSGSPGYAHKTAPEGLWEPEADRFGGAVLVAEMLGWCDERVREAAWGENYFDPYEMQQESARYYLLVNSLHKRWGTGVAGLFERTWRSESLVDCATSGEWLVVLPEEVPKQASEGASSHPVEAPTVSAVQALMTAAQRLEEQGNIAGALEVYRQAQALAPARSGVAQKLALVVKGLEERQVAPLVEERSPGIIAQGGALSALQTESEVELDALFSTGLAAYEREEWAKAQELLGEVVRQQPAYTRDGKRAANLLKSLEKRLGSRRQRKMPGWSWLIGIAAVVAVAAVVVVAAIVAFGILLSNDGAKMVTRTGYVYEIAYSPDGQLVAVASSLGVHLYDAKRLKEVRFIETEVPMLSVAFSPNGTVLASGAQDGTVRLWQVGDGILLYTLEGHKKSIQSVVFSPDGTVLASGSEDSTIRLWEVADGETLRVLRGLGNPVWNVDFSPDGATLVSGSEDRTVRFWDTESGSMLRTLNGHSGAVWDVAFSPDGATVASGSEDGTVRLWNVADWSTLHTLKEHTDWVLSAAFSPNGTILASGSKDGRVFLWDVSEGTVLRVLEGQSGWVTSVAFSPDGTTLAAGSLDSTVRLWDVRGEMSLHTLGERRESTWNATFSDEIALALVTNGDVRLEKRWNEWPMP